MANKDQISFKLKIAWGRRRAAPGEPAPPLPDIPVTASNAEDEEIQEVPYPYLYVYNSKEESLRADEEWIRGREAFPEPEGPPDAKPTWSADSSDASRGQRMASTS